MNQWLAEWDNYRCHNPKAHLCILMSDILVLNDPKEPAPFRASQFFETVL